MEICCLEEKFENQTFCQMQEEIAFQNTVVMVKVLPPTTSNSYLFCASTLTITGMKLSLALKG